MNTVRFPVVTRVFTVLMMLALLLVPASSVFASNGATSYTQTFQNATDSFPTLLPCTNILGTVNITYNGVFHVTINNAGDEWLTGTQTGTAVFVPDDPSQPTYTGHFATWFNFNDNKQNGNMTNTFSVHATGTDGSTISFHEVAHYGVSATGVVVSFDKPVCN